MGANITIDPVTRIEGHLGIHITTENNRVIEAYCAGEMFRGFEQILSGRDPLDAQQITQRICGVCPISHGVASCQAQDIAYGIEPPPNGILLRNLILAANYLQSHITHFYQFSIVDFIDVLAIESYTGQEPALCALKNWIQEQRSSREIFSAAPFLPTYESERVFDNDASIGILHNYFKALNARRSAHQSAAIFAGKVPHAPALVPGGVTEQVDAKRIAAFLSRFKQIELFIDNCYLPDILSAAETFPEFFDIGKGCGNFLAYGVFPRCIDHSNTLYPSGVIVDSTFQPLDIAKIHEDVRYSHFAAPSHLKPESGSTIPQTGKEEAYSWLKAPRYGNSVLETGPLARLLVASHKDENHPAKSLLNRFLKKLNREERHLPSVFGRHLARALECKILVQSCFEWLSDLKPGAPTCTDFTIPEQAEGIGLTEAPRGALGHWLSIKGRKIHNYQCVVPSTWNFSPRDDQGTPGAVEQALTGIPIPDSDNPIDAVRVVRSFDPCLACAVH